MTHKSILLEAEGLVHGDRNADYGHPLDDFTRVAGMLRALKGWDIKAEDIPLIMICLKLSRQSNKPKRDNCVDGAGYFETLEWCINEKYKREVLTETFDPAEEYRC